MRRAALALAAVLVAGGAVVAHADPAACPPGLVDVTGTNPSYADISALLETEAASQSLKIPPQVLKAIAYQETRWRQYAADGHVVISGAADSVCGVGIMQVTAANDPDPQRLATDIAYNIARGAAILREKWAYSQANSNAPVDRPADSDDDPTITENWFYAICLYNGCGSDSTYPQKVAETAADPFRRVTVAAIKPYMPIKGFTKPTEADPAYAFPGAFQARLDPPSFVFYDNGTRAITKTVNTFVHYYGSPSPAVAYGGGTYGPDGPGASCAPNVCEWWRLAEGQGIAGRAHWTRSVLSVEGTRITWAPLLPRTGAYRVSTFVPDVTIPGDAMANAATYHLAGTTVTVDQAAHRGEWVPLGDRTLSPGATVWLNDVSDAAGRQLVADAIRFEAVPTIEVTPSPSTITYGAATNLTIRLTHSGAALAGRTVKLYKRKAGPGPWTYAGSFVTGSGGTVTVAQRPGSNAEYHAVFEPPSTDYARAVSAGRRVNVATLVRASLSRTTVPRNTGVTISASVAPSHAGQAVYLQRSYSGTYRTVLSRTLSGSSTASFAFAQATPGTYTFRACKPADADHVAACSGPLTLRVT